MIPLWVLKSKMTVVRIRMQNSSDSLGERNAASKTRALRIDAWKAYGNKVTVL